MYVCYVCMAMYNNMYIISNMYVCMAIMYVCMYVCMYV
jgi:hypothetical protein